MIRITPCVVVSACSVSLSRVLPVAGIAGTGERRVREQRRGLEGETSPLPVRDRLSPRSRPASTYFEEPEGTPRKMLDHGRARLLLFSFFFFFFTKHVDLLILPRQLRDSVMRCHWRKTKLKNVYRYILCLVYLTPRNSTAAMRFTISSWIYLGTGFKFGSPVSCDGIIPCYCGLLVASARSPSMLFALSLR